MRRYINLIKALYFIELLRLAKKRLTWSEISGKLDESPAALSRYMHGHVVPSGGKMDRLISLLEDVIDFEREILDRIRFDTRSGFIDNQKLISDVKFLDLIAKRVASKYIGKIDVVLSPAADGIPFATLVANYMDCNLCIIKHYKETAVHRYVEGLIYSEDGGVRPLYLPRTLIRKGYRALIVDDVIRTGATHKAIVDMISKVKARVEAISVLIVIGDSWRSRISDVAVDYLAYMP